MYFLCFTVDAIGNTNQPYAVGFYNCSTSIDSSIYLRKEISAISSRITALENQKRGDETVLVNLKNATLVIEIAAFLVAFFVAWSGIWVFIEYKKVKAQIESRLDELNTISAKIKIIQKDLTGSQAYVQQGHENLFDCLQVYANTIGDKGFLNLIFEKRAITSLYSLEEESRFTGITTLRETGRNCDVIHLEKLLFNKDESIKNKHLANDAIIAIKMRKKP